MAGNAKHRRTVQLRKEKQAAARRLASLRLEAVNYEGVTESIARRMSPERLKEIIRTGKRRKGLTGAPLTSVTAAMVAAAMTRS